MTVTKYQSHVHAMNITLTVYIFFMTLTKYVKHVFCAGMKKGFLFKKKKVDNVYNSRFCILDTKNISYFKKITVSVYTHMYAFLTVTVTLNF